VDVSNYRKNFFTGIAVLLPAALTVLLFQNLWNVMDSLIVNPLYRALPVEFDKRLFVFLVKSAILVCLFALVCLAGWATNLLIVRQVIKLGEGILARVPIIYRVYSTLKDISTTVLGKDDKSDMFRSAVLIEYPRKGVYSIAFVTKADHPVLSQASGKSLMSVFLPTTPNPTSGVLLFLPREEVHEINFSVEEAVKLVISAGTLTGKTPEELAPRIGEPAGSGWADKMPWRRKKP